MEKEKATRSRILAWEIPWAMEPGGLHWGCKESDTNEQLNTDCVKISVFFIFTPWSQPFCCKILSVHKEIEKDDVPCKFESRDTYIAESLASVVRFILFSL